MRFRVIEHGLNDYILQEKGWFGWRDVYFAPTLADALVWLDKFEILYEKKMHPKVVLVRDIPKDEIY